MNYDAQIQRQFGIAPKAFNQAKMSRNAPAQAAQPTNEAKVELAKMAKAERRRRLLAGDATHQLLQLVRATARQEGLTTAALMSAMVDRVYTSTHASDLAPDESTDDLTSFMADVGRLSRMRETRTEDPEGFDNLRASLWDRFSKLISDDQFGDDSPDDDDSVNPVASEGDQLSTDTITFDLQNPSGSLYDDRSSDVSNSTDGQRADSRAPSPVDKNPVTKTRPGFVAKPTPSFHQVHFAQHGREFPSSGGLLLNVTRAELAQAQKARKA